MITIASDSIHNQGRNSNEFLTLKQYMWLLPLRGAIPSALFVKFNKEWLQNGVKYSSCHSYVAVILQSIQL